MVTSGTAAKHTGLNNQVFGSNDINPLFPTPCWNSGERRVHDGRLGSPPCLCTLTEDVFTQAQVQAKGRGVWKINSWTSAELNQVVAAPAKQSRRRVPQGGTGARVALVAAAPG